MRPRASNPATYYSSTPRIQAPAVARWHAHPHSLATPIHELSGLFVYGGRGLCSGYGTRLILCKYLILLYLTLALSTASLIRPTRDFVKEKRSSGVSPFFPFLDLPMLEGRDKGWTGQSSCVEQVWYCSTSADILSLSLLSSPDYS